MYYLGMYTVVAFWLQLYDDDSLTKIILTGQKVKKLGGWSKVSVSITCIDISVTSE